MGTCILAVRGSQSLCAVCWKTLLPENVPRTLPVCTLLILAVISSEPLIATVESALMSSDVKPAHVSVLP